MSVFSAEVVVDNVVPIEGGNPTAVKVDGSAVTQPVSGPLTDAQLRATPVPVSGTVTTSPVVSSTANSSRVTVTTSSQVLFAANANRKKVIIQTESGTGNVYVNFGLTASATNYTYIIGSLTTLEIGTWQGAISVVRSSGSSSLTGTELV